MGYSPSEYDRGYGDGLKDGRDEGIHADTRRKFGGGAVTIVALASIGLGFAGGTAFGRETVQRAVQLAGLDIHTAPSATPSESGPSPEPSPSSSLTPESSPTATSTPNITPTPSTSPQTLKRVVFIDAGHGGSNETVTDGATGLQDTSSTNSPEREEMFEAALMVKEILATEGIKAVIGKKSATDTMTHRQRTEAARATGADIAVSLHDDHGQQYDKFQAVYSQVNGQYRVTKNGDKIAFHDAETACESQAYSERVLAAREVAQGLNVRSAQLNFARRSLADGNIALVALFAQADKKHGKAGIPWVYNEMGGKTSSSETKALPHEKLEKYAQGIANGVLQSVAEMDAIEKQCEA